MHVVVKDKTAELKTEATVQLDTLASRCKKENGKLEIWVSVCVRYRFAVVSGDVAANTKEKQNGNKLLI